MVAAHEVVEPRLGSVRIFVFRNHHLPSHWLVIYFGGPKAVGVWRRSVRSGHMHTLNELSYSQFCPYTTYTQYTHSQFLFLTMFTHYSSGGVSDGDRSGPGEGWFRDGLYSGRSSTGADSSRHAQRTHRRGSHPAHPWPCPPHPGLLRHQERPHAGRGFAARVGRCSHNPPPVLRRSGIHRGDARRFALASDGRGFEFVRTRGLDILDADAVEPCQRGTPRVGSPSRADADAGQRPRPT